MPQTPYFIYLDDARHHRLRHYQNWCGEDTIGAQDLSTIDTLLAKGWQKKWHAVVLADYDFGLPLVDLPTHPQHPSSGKLHIHWFESLYILDKPDTIAQYFALQHPSHQTPTGLAHLQLDTSETDYLQDIAKVKAAIQKGEVYQINYTTRLHFAAYGDPIALYQKLRQQQQVPYGVLAHLPENDQEDYWHLGFSPELFLAIQDDGLIKTEPMKGTAPILHDDQDEARAIALQNDPKNRAENIMIVDLLRNDLGKLATVGGVSVPHPFQVNAFGPVWQMTTEVIAQMQEGTRIGDILQAAYPCGSITGAPKRFAMHLINQLEKTPRHLYTGSIGYLEPCTTGLGFTGQFNVVIRSLHLEATTKQQFTGQMGVGSGIVIDSDAKMEYEECGWKSQFLRRIQPDFSLFETILVEKGQAKHWPRHQNRLLDAAHDLNFQLDPDYLAQTWQVFLSTIGEQNYRVRLCLRPNNQIDIEHFPIHALHGTPSFILSDVSLPQSDLLRCYKTSHRPWQDLAWQQAEQQHAFDALLFNENQILLEGGRSNVFVRFGQQWCTPSLDLDILNGVMRQTVLANSQTYLGVDKVLEKHINKEAFLQADEVRLCNALRGLFTATLNRAQ